MIISLSILLILSVAVNILLVWYIRRMLKELLFSSDNIVQLQLTLADFSTHLQGVYEQETYYGDPTIEGLIRHAKEVVVEVNDFQDIYSSSRDEARNDLLGEEEDGEKN